MQDRTQEVSWTHIPRIRSGEEQDASCVWWKLITIKRYPEGPTWFQPGNTTWRNQPIILTHTQPIMEVPGQTTVGIISAQDPIEIKDLFPDWQVPHALHRVAQTR